MLFSLYALWVKVLNMSISEVTRRNIFDFLTIEKVNWAGRLNEDDFLGRIFKVTELPSTDSRFSSAAGDIWQHRVNNPYDWDDDWVFYDGRFNLLGCSDEIFLKFLCEMIHPVVRSDIEECQKLASAFNDALRDDGLEVYPASTISGRGIYDARLLGVSRIPTYVKALPEKFNSKYIATQIDRMEKAIEDDPETAIGSAKEFIETICKTILSEYGVENVDKLKFNDLVKEARGQLNLLPADIDNRLKGEAAFKKILQSASTMLDGMGEIRNLYGSGHGKHAGAKGLEPRHARLVVGVASTLGSFLFDCYERQRCKR